MTEFLSQSPHAAVLALDEMRLCSQASVMRVWAAVGHTPVIPLDPQRAWHVIYGALDLRTGREIAVEALTTNRVMTANFLLQLTLLLPDHPILILWDRASWHQGGAVQHVLDQHPHLHVRFFPTACPDLNPQEHIWKAARQAITHNHRGLDFAQMCQEVMTFLNETPFTPAFLDTVVA